MQRLALCCHFLDAPIRFKTTTVKYISSLDSKGIDRLEYLGKIIENNLKNLLLAIDFCSRNGIGSFRINSAFFPVYTHPTWGYEIKSLPNYSNIKKLFLSAKKSAETKNIRLTFHPDQFVVLNTPKEDTLEKSIADLEYHGLMAKLLGADVINIHGGGGYGDKNAAIKRFAKNFEKLSKETQSLLTIENDDRVYTPEELFPLCKDLNIPLVYDVHHHRCLPDQWSIEMATEKALETWNREPLFHISSPKEGWKGKNPRLHHEFIDIKDVPQSWSSINNLTIDIEAKNKEHAVLQLREELVKKGWKIG